MKKSLIALLVVYIVAAGCSRRSGGNLSKLRTDTDSVAYILGMNIGVQLSKIDSTLNVAALCEGIRDVYNKKEAFTSEEAKNYYLRYMNYMLPEKARAYEEQFLADFAKSNRSFARTSTGITYAVESVGDQDMVPSSDRDSVVILLTIRTADGQERYSSVARGDSLCMELGDMTRGMKESVKLIGKGGKIDAWMPSAMAFGAEGNEEFGARPNETLRFEIDLLEVDKYSTRIRRKK